MWGLNNTQLVVTAEEGRVLELCRFITNIFWEGTDEAKKLKMYIPNFNRLHSRFWCNVSYADLMNDSHCETNNLHIY